MNEDIIVQEFQLVGRKRIKKFKPIFNSLSSNMKAFKKCKRVVVCVDKFCRAVGARESRSFT